MRKAFTLIEVMVSVLIISVVIMALLQMKGNSSHIFSNISKKNEIYNYISYFISNHDYGFENDIITLDKLLGDFEVENELRQELKRVKIDIIHQEVEQVDENVSTGVIFDVSKTILKTDKSSVSLIRLRTQ